MKKFNLSAVVFALFSALGAQARMPCAGLTERDVRLVEHYWSEALAESAGRTHRMLGKVRDAQFKANTCMADNEIQGEEEGQNSGYAWRFVAVPVMWAVGSYPEAFIDATRFYPNMAKEVVADRRFGVEDPINSPLFCEAMVGSARAMRSSPRCQQRNETLLRDIVNYTAAVVRANKL